MKPRVRIIALPLLVAICGFAILLLGVTPARAATFTVTNSNDSGPGSLRQAILETNISPGADTIDFAIPGAGIHTITLASPLPMITDQVFIDSYTQAGSLRPTESAPATIMIDINGSGGAGTCFEFSGASCANSRISGVAIHSFQQNGIQIGAGITGVQIDGNIVGLKADGSDGANGTSGIFINGSSANTIGGSYPENRNVISENGVAGINSGGGTGNYVSGNYIGTDVTGSAVRANTYGIYSSGDNDTIGA